MGWRGQDRRLFSLGFEEAVSWGRSSMMWCRSTPDQGDTSASCSHHDNLQHWLSCVPSTACQAFDTGTVLMSRLSAVERRRLRSIKVHYQVLLPGNGCTMVWLPFVYSPRHCTFEEIKKSLRCKNGCPSRSELPKHSLDVAGPSHGGSQ